MKDREKAIIMAYTGTCMLTGDKFEKFHEYVEELMGRPVLTHELANKKVQDEIKEKSKADFMKLCDEEEPLKDCMNNPDETPEQKQMEEIVNYYGANDRLRLLMEECGELIQASNKILRYPNSDKAMDNLLEEMVDVSIMIQQIRTLLKYDEPGWDHMMQYKINRCKKRYIEDITYTRNMYYNNKYYAKYYTKKASDKK
jgi:NTP pyrophosphatase (non-canonical NTP hydrolase)